MKTWLESNWRLCNSSNRINILLILQRNFTNSFTGFVVSFELVSEIFLNWFSFCVQAIFFTNWSVQFLANSSNRKNPQEIIHLSFFSHLSDWTLFCFLFLSLSLFFSPSLESNKRWAKTKPLVGLYPVFDGLLSNFWRISVTFSKDFKSSLGRFLFSISPPLFFLSLSDCYLKQISVKLYLDFDG